jgi:hypothetical protein
LLPFLPAQSLPKSHTPSAGYLRTVAHRSYTALEGEAQVTTSLPQLCTSLSRGYHEQQDPTHHQWRERAVLHLRVRCKSHLEGFHAAATAVQQPSRIPPGLPAQVAEEASRRLHLLQLPATSGGRTGISGVARRPAKRVVPQLQMSAQPGVPAGGR